MPGGSRRRSIADIMGWIATGAMVAGSALAWLRVVPALTGFAIYAIGGVIAVIAGVSALVAAARGRRFGSGRAVALLAAMVFVVTASPGFGPPAINDFTTDPGDPPGFVKALLSEANRGRDMSYPTEFAAIQAECCADIKTERLPIDSRAAFARALAAARQMPGWTIELEDPVTGQIEAVATSRVFGFKDDIAIRIRSDGAGSKVDVRSKSRDGRGDQGANAARIRMYLEALRTTR